MKQKPEQKMSSFIQRENKENRKHSKISMCRRTISTKYHNLALMMEIL